MRLPAMALSLLLSTAAALGLLQAYFEGQVNHRDEYLAVFDPERLATAHVLVVGDSHAKDAFNRLVLPPSVLNVAYGSDSLREDFLKAKHALDLSPTIRTLVIQADYHVFAGYRLASNNKFRSFYFSSARDIESVHGETLSEMERRLYVTLPILYGPNRSTTIQVLRRHLSTIAGGRTAEPDGPEDLAEWSDVPPERRAAEARARVDRQFRDGVLSEELVEAFRRIVDLAHERGVTVVAVAYPLSDEYREALSTAPYDLRDVRERIRESGVDRFLDYAEAFSGEPSLFLNQDHLNRQGAVRFISQVLTDLGLETRTDAAVAASGEGR